MELNETGSIRNRIPQTALAVALAIVAIISLRKGKRLSGALAGVGALALGYSTTTGPGEVTETLEIGTTSEGDDGDLRCAICGQPIVPGQRRGPDASGEIVHEACEESVE